MRSDPARASERGIVCVLDFLRFSPVVCSDIVLAGVLHQVAILYRNIYVIDDTDAPVSVETTFSIIAPHVKKEDAVGENDATGRLLVAVTVAVDRRRFMEVQTKNLAFLFNVSPGTNDQ